MMKQLALAMILIFSLGCLTAIEVSGNQSGVWDPINNPYQVVGAITVPAGQSLQILAGVEVQIMGSFQITVAGTMQAVGTEADSIRFVNTIQPGLWPGLRFENETQASFVEHISVEYATIGIRCMNSPMTISQSRFDHCEKGMELYAIGDTEPNAVTVDHCLIENCIQNGILIAQNSAAVITNNEIRYNGTGPQFRAAIQLSNQSAGGSNNPLIDGNHIHHNLKQGISAWDVASVNAINPTITNNIIEYNYTGIYYLQASGYCADNQINYNFIPGDMNSGAGVMVSGVTSTPYFERNTISGNYAGLYITNNAMPVLGDLSIYHAWAQGENYIQGNIDANGNNNAIFCAAYANAGNIIKAENNYWDFNTAAEINSVIMDHTDSAALPTIDFDPWLEEVEETTLIGTIVADMFESQATVELVSVSDGLVLGTTVIELTDQINWVFSPTEPFYALVRVSNGWRDQTGVAGGRENPTVFNPSLRTVINLGQIVCTDSTLWSWERVGDPVMEEGNLVYPVYKGVYFYHWNTIEWLYYDGDYQKIYKYTLFDDENTLNYIVPPEYRTWEKVYNLAAGDTWSKRLISFQDGNPTFLNLTATVFEINRTLSNMNTKLMVSYRDSEGREHSQWIYEAETHHYFTRYIAPYGGCYMKDHYILIPETVIDDGSIFPIVAGNYYKLQPQYSYYNPTMLSIDIRAALHENLGFRFYWQPMIYEGGNLYPYYRIYRNYQLVATLPAQMGFMTYEEPYPEVQAAYFYQVVAASDNSETDPSELTLYWVSNDDLVTVPTSLSVYPNPCVAGRDALTIKTNANAGSVLTIFNLRGQLVRELPVSTIGESQSTWDLRDSRGKLCGSGIYYLRLDSPGASPMQKRVLILQ